MSFRLNTLILAVAAAVTTLSPLAVSAQGIPTHDGFQLIGDTLVRVEQTCVSGKTRAEVLAELAAWRKNPVHADGWAEVNGGDSLRYVGVFKPAAAPMAASGDLRVAAGEGFSMGVKAEPKLNVNDLPVHLRFGRH